MSGALLPAPWFQSVDSHSLLIATVNAHVLKDSLILIRQLESVVLARTECTLADVVALYPLINIKDGMKALQWFTAIFLDTSEFAADIPQALTICSEK
jgi:hypothetical protein